MNANAYEIIALAMRYVFAALMLLIVLRALLVTMVDSRRAGELRRLNPETGIIGEFLIMDSAGWARRGASYPVTLEGTIGSSRRCDIRIRRNGLHARHAYYQMTEKGLYVRGHANITLLDEDGTYLRERILLDGDTLYIGRLEMMLVLYDASMSQAHATPKKRRHAERDRCEAERPAPERRMRPPQYEAEFEADDFERSLFEPEAEDPDDIFFTNPAARQHMQPETDDYDQDYDL